VLTTIEVNLALAKQTAVSYDKSQRETDPAQRRAAREAMHDELKALFEHMMAVKPVMPSKADRRRTFRAIGMVKWKFLPDLTLDKVKARVES